MEVSVQKPAVGKILNKLTIAILFSLTFIPALTIVVPMIANIERRPRFLIRQHILRQTPMGTNIEDVVAFVERKDSWALGHVDVESGFAVRRSLFIFRDLQISPPVSGMSVSANLGSFHAWYIFFGLPEVTTIVRWGFDEDGNLIEIFVTQGWSI